MKHPRLMSAVAALSLPLAFLTQASAAPAPAPRPNIAKICLNCHQPQEKVIRGHLDSVSFKSKVLQVKVDDAAEVLSFDEKSLQVVNEERKAGDGALLKDNKIKKGHEVRVEFTEKDGVKRAVKLTAKPPVELPKEMLIGGDALKKLVEVGPARGKFHLFDSRPAPRFLEGTIPGAVNLPFPAFDKMADKLLPADKHELLIFFCSGTTCNMSPSSAKKAQVLGYTRIKVYKEGVPGWSEKNYSVLTAQAFKEAFLDKEVSHVLLDARSKAVTGQFIKGAVSIPAVSAANMVKGMGLKQKKAPIVVYDAGNGKDAAKVAQQLLKAGYGNVKVMTGGFRDWKAAGFPIESGRPAVKVAFVPKLRQGEIDPEEFKKYAASLPADVMIVDVRLPEEVKKGMVQTAKSVPLVEMRERLADLPKEKTIVLQCNTGTQAEIAYNTLKELGYTKVKYLSAKVSFGKDGSWTLTKE